MNLANKFAEQYQCGKCHHWSQDPDSWYHGWCKNPKRRTEPTEHFPNGFAASINYDFTCEYHSAKRGLKAIQGIAEELSLIPPEGGCDE